MDLKPKDVLLLVLVAGLIVAALWPTDEQPAAPVPDSPASSGDADSQPREPSTSAPAADATEPTAPKPQAAEPLLGAGHDLFPLVAGSRWIYAVRGPENLVPADSWTLELRSIPTDGEPGVIVVGFGEQRLERSVWLDEGKLRIDGLPCVEPLEYRGNRPTKVGGVFLPTRQQVVVGATWNAEYERSVEHVSRDRQGRGHPQRAIAKQQDRAVVDDFDETIVPAGRFDSYRIEWTGSITLKVGKRPVLAGLTAGPFRSETTWIAPGVGIVRRLVRYGGSSKNAVSFNLLEYTRPTE